MPAISAAKKQVNKEKKKHQQQLTEVLQTVQQTVKACNKEPDILQHFPVFATYSHAEAQISLQFRHADQLSPEQKCAIWDLFEANMKEIYLKDDQKWQPKEKRRELFDEEARYFLAIGEGGKLVGFSHFRFEVEDNQLCEEDMQLFKLPRYDPVVYCYELQLHPCMQRKGLGKRLMQMLELVALKYAMHMVMLTVQKSNTSAWAFYTSLGYKQHPSCPSRNDFEDFDGQDPGHRILFKDLRRS